MKQIILILPVLSGIMFGASGVFVRKLTAHGIDNPTILFLRVVLALFLISVGILIYDRTLFKVQINDIPIFIGTGLMGMLGLNLCYNLAIKKLTLSLAAVLLSTAPIFVMFLAAVIFKEQITLKKLGCMFLAIIGCILASGLLDQKTELKLSLTGILAGVAAALFYALYSIFARKATDKNYHTYTVIFYSLLLITLALLPFADYGKIGCFVSKNIFPNLAFLLFHALCTAVLPYVLLTLALLYAEAGSVSILASGGEPIAAVIFGLIFYAETPSLVMLAGLAITIVALAFLCMKPKQEDSGKGQPDEPPHRSDSQ